MMDRVESAKAVFLVPLLETKLITDYAMIDRVLNIQAQKDYGDIAKHAEFIRRIEAQRRAA